MIFSNMLTLTYYKTLSHIVREQIFPLEPFKTLGKFSTH